MNITCSRGCGRVPVYDTGIDSETGEYLHLCEQCITPEEKQAVVDGMAITRRAPDLPTEDEQQ